MHDRNERSIRDKGDLSLDSWCQQARSDGGAADRIDGIRNLISVWQDACAAGRSPTRQDFLPEALVSILPDLFMVDVLDRGDMRYRLVGTRLAASFERDPTGQRVDSLLRGSETEKLRDVLSECVATGKPLAGTTYLLLSTGIRSHLQFATLPLTATPDSDKITMVIGAVAHTHGVPGLVDLPVTVAFNSIVPD